MKPTTPVYLLFPLVSTFPTLTNAIDENYPNLSFNASAVDLSGIYTFNESKLHNLTDSILFHSDLPTFIATRNTVHGPHDQLDWVPNECIGGDREMLGWDFQPACLRHIWGYMNYARQHRLDRRARQNIDNLFRIDTLKMCKREKHDKVCSVVAWMYRIKLVNRHKKRVEGIGGGVEIESEAEREQREKEEKEDLERNAEMWRKADEEKKKKEKEEEERKEKEEEERERKEEEEEEEKERKEKEEKEKEKAKDKTYKRWAEQEMFSAPGLDVVAKGWIG